MTKKIQWKPRSSHSDTTSGLHNRVAGRIGSLIVQGELAPETVLPNEADLGNEFGVSRTALREAIKVLSAKGLLEARRKTGTRVRSAEDWNMLDPEILTWLFSGREIPQGLDDLIEVRRAIEPAAARIAAKRATSENIAEIEAALTDMEDAVKDLSASVEADLNFHLAILKSTHNIFMRPFGALIQAALRGSFRLTSSNYTRYRRTLPLHRAVLDAIKAGEEERAAAAMSTMLTQTSRDITAEVHKRSREQASSSSALRRKSRG